MKGQSRLSRRSSILSFAFLWTATAIHPPQARAQNAAVGRSVMPVSRVSGAVGASIRPMTLPSGLFSLGQGGISFTALPAGLSLPAAITPQANASAARRQAPASAVSAQAPAVSAAEAAETAPA
ncbi:MAG: hypothetical protein AAB339_05810, partial [Elusimicrobiota bacterium]